MFGLRIKKREIIYFSHWVRDERFDEQTEIVAQVETKLSNIAQAETEIKRSLERAARLRQAILKRAFEGRLV